MFVRVEDPDTGHQFDVDESDPRVGNELKALKDYPTSRLARPDKPRVSKSGQAPASAEATSVVETKAEPAAASKKGK